MDQKPTRKSPSRARRRLIQGAAAATGIAGFPFIRTAAAQTTT